MAVKTICLEGVGDVVLEHSRRAKHIKLSVKPFKGIRVAVPLRVSLHQAELATRSKMAWLKKHQQRVANLEQKALDFHAANALNPAAARKAIVTRLSELAALHGFTPGKVSVRNQKTRWGSCSSNNNISLNMRIVQLPSELMDYIILHELVHTRIRNHGPRFSEALAKLIPNAKQLDRRMNRYGFVLAG